MSTSITSTSDLLSAAAAAAKKANTADAAATAAANTSTAGSSSNALSSLTSNYNQFLSLLTAQLQHQDPTSPMQTDSFTSELAQFAGVEQQINTNTNLTQLLSLTQDSQVGQSSSLVGKQAIAATSQLPLQNGSAKLQINSPAAGTVGIAITNSAGTVVKTQSVAVDAGTTDWKWDGKDDSGNALSDGSYDAAVVTAGASGTSASVPFDIIGTITGVSKSPSGGISLQMGSTTLDMASVSSLVGASTSTSSGGTTS